MLGYFNREAVANGSLGSKPQGKWYDPPHLLSIVGKPEKQAAASMPYNCVAPISFNPQPQARCTMDLRLYTMDLRLCLKVKRTNRVTTC